MGAGRDGHPVAAPPDRRQGRGGVGHRRLARRRRQRRARRARPFGVRHADMPLTPAQVWRAMPGPPAAAGPGDRRRAVTRQRPARARRTGCGPAHPVRPGDGGAGRAPDERQAGRLRRGDRRRHDGRVRRRRSARSPPCARERCGCWRRASPSCCGSPRTRGAAPAQDGVRTVGNPCLSGGTLEIFLEAMIPPTLVAVVRGVAGGAGARRVGAALDWDVRTGLDPLSPDTSAVVVASHGRGELAVLRAALSAGVGYIALVASRRRAAGVLDELGATEAERRASTPRRASTSAPGRPRRSRCRCARASSRPGRGSRGCPTRPRRPGRRWRSTRSAGWRCWWRTGRCRRATCTSADRAASPPGRPAE